MKFLHIKENNTIKNEILLVGLGDIHYGSKDCDIKKVMAEIDWIKSKPNARVILMGDLIDVGLKDSVGAGTYDNNIEPEQQLENIIDILKPIKTKIWCSLTGNHEERIRERTSIDVSKLIAKALDIPYMGYSCMIKAKIGPRNYTIFAAHGNTGAVSTAGKLNAVLKYGSYIDADLYMMGHVHEMMHHTSEYFRVSNKDKMVIKDKRHYIITGHFLKYGGYAQAKGYAPGKTGMPKIILRDDKKGIYVSI